VEIVVATTTRRLASSHGQHGLAAVRAWICDFSSTHNTMASWGGVT
jgi:hypothetical protein